METANAEIISWNVEITLMPYNVPAQDDEMNTVIASEMFLDDDWSGPEEDEAWKDL